MDSLSLRLLRNWKKNVIKILFVFILYTYISLLLFYFKSHLFLTTWMGSDKNSLNMLIFVHVQVFQVYSYVAW